MINKDKMLYYWEGINTSIEANSIEEARSKALNFLKDEKEKLAEVLTKTPKVSK